MSKITVRDATREDAEFLVRGNALMALETEGISLELERLRDGVHAVFDEAARGRYFIAEADGARAGQMMITYEWSDWRNGVFWWIQSVYVVPEARRKGVFAALYRHVRAAAVADGRVSGIRLYVENHNEPAMASYERAGMKRTIYQMFEEDFVIPRAN
jgi:ribosomal protein S18 acetylase RimI-like enzyme